MPLNRSYVPCVRLGRLSRHVTIRLNCPSTADLESRACVARGATSEGMPSDLVSFTKAAQFALTLEPEMNYTRLERPN